MIKLLFGEEAYLINQELRKITGGFDSPVIFDETTSPDDLIQELETKSLFSDTKQITINNFNFKKHSKDLTKVIKSLESILENDEVIFVIEEKALPKNDLIEWLKINATTTEFKTLKESQLSTFIINFLKQKNGQIDRLALSKIIELLPNNLFIITNELMKLLSNNQQISLEMVNDLTPKYYEDNYFELSNAITSGNVSQIIKSFDNKKHLGVSNMIIISQLASMFAISLRLNSLKELGLNDSAIALELNLHSFRVKKIKELITNTSIKKIKDILYLLAEIETMVKSGKATEENAMTLLLLKLIR